MKSVYLFACIIYLIPFLASAQSNYKPGLVVKTPGDTLRGFIDYQEWISNPTSVSFKPTLDQKDEQELTPLNCKYFEVDTEAYQSYQGRVSADRIELNKITSQIDTSKIVVAAFLKVLLTGDRVTLLRLTDNIKARFFLQDKQEKIIQELGFRRYYDVNKANAIVNSKAFMGQFWVIASKHGVATLKLKNTLEQAEYNTNDLSAICKIINNTTEEPKHSTNKTYRFLLGAGFNHSVTSVEGAHPLAHPDTKNKSSIAPKFVIGADRFFNPNVKRLIMRAEIAFTQTDQEMTRKTDFTDAHEAFKQNIISFSPQIIYNFYNKENFKVFTGSGLSANMASYKMVSYYLLDNFWFALPVRIGLTFKNYELSAIYSPPYNISKFTDFTFVTRTAQVQLNYLFTK